MSSQDLPGLRERVPLEAGRGTGSSLAGREEVTGWRVGWGCPGQGQCGGQRSRGGRGDKQVSGGDGRERNRKRERLLILEQKEWGTEEEAGGLTVQKAEENGGVKGHLRVGSDCVPPERGLD